MTDPQLRTFTIEEANALIPTLTGLLHQIKKKHSEIEDLEAQIDVVELIGGKENKKTILEMSALIKQHHLQADEFYSLVDKIHVHGCYLKDVFLGVVDFYSVLHGEIVFLCWKLGEERIKYWHPTDRGYAFRELIEGETPDSNEEPSGSEPNDAEEPDENTEEQQ